MTNKSKNAIMITVKGGNKMYEIITMIAVMLIPFSPFVTGSKRKRGKRK